MHTDLGRSSRHKKVLAPNSIGLLSGVGGVLVGLEAEAGFEGGIWGELEEVVVGRGCSIMVGMADLAGCRTASAPDPSVYACVLLQFLS